MTIGNIKLPPIILLFMVGLSWSSRSHAQTPRYEKAYNQLESMLKNTEQGLFKEAVFITENAYFDGQLSKDDYERNIQALSELSVSLSINNTLLYDDKDQASIEKCAAIFTLITDTIPLISQNGNKYFHYPFTYDFDDPFGKGDWSTMFVTKLLATKKGNCHSLPYLYKIIADKIGADAHLALAPNHIYIKNRSEKTGWYNTELTSASFPVDAWIMASGDVYLEAIQNGIYMKALGDREAITMCVIDLAMGYDHKFPNNDGTFVLKCCDLALEYFPNYITAILLKAETKRRLIQQMMEQHNVQNHKDLFPLVSDSKSLWKQMEQTYFQAHKLGYRQMPKQMYLDWLASLNEEREKYDNRKVTRFDD